jgi:methylglutaconyl-CoA hydratase
VGSVKTEITGNRAVITLARPERHNAFDDSMIVELTSAFQSAGANRFVRVIVLQAQGTSFSAGADLAWMRRMADYSDEENRRDAQALAGLLKKIDQCPKPVIALVQGAAYGGGVGLIAACDVAVAATTAVFAFSEVKLGLIPATISPYIVAAMGARAARRYFLTAEKFSADEALRLGLVHELVAAEELSVAGERIVTALLQGGPEAQAAVKKLVRAVANAEPNEALIDWTADRIAAVRASVEGREGVAAFLEKREPRWRGRKE